MSEQRYKAAIVGLTGIGARRAAEAAPGPLSGPMPRSHAGAYHQHDRTDVVAVCDIREETLQAFKKTWADVWPQVRLYTDYREMIDREQPDILSVATSDHAHAEITVAGAEAGAAMIFCEKPISTSLADADRMIEATDRHGALLSVDHTRRWEPKFVQAREIIRSGEMGKLCTVVMEQLSPRAMLFRNGTHMIDLICFFAEASPAWLVAELEEGFDHFTEYVGDGGHDPKTDPYASAYIRFGNGVRAFYNAFKTQMPGSQCSLNCEQGRIEVSDRGLKVIRGASNHQWSATDIAPDSYRCERQLAAVAELIHVHENGGELVSSGREARKTVEIMLGILRSHHAGNVRVDLPLSE